MGFLLPGNQRIQPDDFVASADPIEKVRKRCKFSLQFRFEKWLILRKDAVKQENGCPRMADPIRHLFDRSSLSQPTRHFVPQYLQ
jgi:hypothetical protein